MGTGYQIMLDLSVVQAHESELEPLPPQPAPQPVEQVAKIIFNNVCPPIPDRRFDWSATRDGYEPGCLIGWGRTKEAAEADLIAQEEEQKS